MKKILDNISIRYIGLRLLWGIPVLLAVVVTSFIVLRFTPGGPFDREKPLPPNILKNLRTQYRLDRPMLPVYMMPEDQKEKEEILAFEKKHGAFAVGPVHLSIRGTLETQLFSYLGQLAKGDLGVSMKFTQVSVNDIIKRTFPVSLTLGLLAFFLAFLIGIILGTAAAYYQNSWLDRAVMLFSAFGFSMPNFVLAAGLIFLFSLKAHIFPPALWEGPLYWVLPVVTLALAPASYIARLTRSGVIESLHEDFIRTARAKGVSEKMILLKHALVNALGPLITIGGPLLAMLVTGSFIIELVFSIPGMGRYFVTAVIDRDYPLVMGVTVVYASFIVIANIAVDVLYGIIDPRVEV